MTRGAAQPPVVPSDLVPDEQIIRDLLGVGVAEAHVATMHASRGAELELSPRRLWLLVHGDVVVERGDRPIEVWRAPRVLDLAGSVLGERSIALTATSDVRCIGIARDAVPAEALAAALARESADLWRRIETDARREDDMFLPWAEPVPGPWHFRRASAIALVMQGDAKRLRACVPPRLRLVPALGHRYLLVLSRFEDVGTADESQGERFAYHEVTPFIPVWSGLRAPAAFIPELYPDAAMAVLLGREIHGFPKRLARIGFHEHGGELIVARRLALRMRWSSREPLDPSDGIGALARAFTGVPGIDRATSWLTSTTKRALRMSVVVHKRIGAAVTAGRTREIDTLVRVPFELDPVRYAARLTGLEVDIDDSVGILHGRPLAGVVLESGLRLGAGRSEGRGG
jgi:hypothetical protein